MAKRKSTRRAPAPKRPSSYRKVERHPSRPVLASPLAYQSTRWLRHPVVLPSAVSASRSRQEAHHAKHKGQAASAATSQERHRVRSKLALTAQREPDKRKSSEKARDHLTCKKRPDSREAARTKRGKGAGVKKFVPWC